MKDFSVGIASTGIYLPENYHDSAYIARETGIPIEVIEKKFGIKRKPRAGYKDQSAYMAVKAAQKALDGHDPKEIDLLIWTGSEHKDFYVWSAGIKVQHEIGAQNAWAIDVAARCSTNIVALKLARDIMRSDPSINTVLLAGGHRTCDLIDYKNERARFLINLSDGGSAILLKKNHPKNLVLGTSIITDGAFSEDVIIPAGGTRMPTSHETIDRGLHFFDVPDPQGMKERLDKLSMSNFIKVIREAVEKSGYKVEDIDYLALLHMKRSAHDYILSELGLNQSQSIYLDDYGHIGAPDQVLSLELACRQGKVKDGDLAVLASAGIGYTWAATAIKWGPVA